jgi:hypothetical protein
MGPVRVHDGWHVTAPAFDHFLRPPFGDPLVLGSGHEQDGDVVIVERQVTADAPFPLPAPVIRNRDALSARIAGVVDERGDPPQDQDELGIRALRNARSRTVLKISTCTSLRTQLKKNGKSPGKHNPHKINDAGTSTWTRARDANFSYAARSTPTFPDEPGYSLVTAQGPGEK